MGEVDFFYVMWGLNGFCWLFCGLVLVGCVFYWFLFIVCGLCMWINFVRWDVGCC